MKKQLKKVALLACSVLALASCGSKEITEDEYKAKCEAMSAKKDAGYTSATLTGSYTFSSSGTVMGVSFASKIDAKLELVYTVSSGVLALKEDKSTYSSDSMDSAKEVVEASLLLVINESASSATIEGAKYYDDGDNKVSVKVEEKTDESSSVGEVYFNQYGFVYKYVSKVESSEEGTKISSNMTWSIAFAA